MAFPRVPLSRFPPLHGGGAGSFSFLLSPTPTTSITTNPIFTTAATDEHQTRVRAFNSFNPSYETTQDQNQNRSFVPPPPPPHSSSGGYNHRWRPMCLYYTQGKCTKVNPLTKAQSIPSSNLKGMKKMDDPVHLDRFNHDCSRDLLVNANAAADDFEVHGRPQPFDFFLVLDLEGRVEILEFPVLIIDAKTLAFIDLFHRFVRPSAMSEERINEYIQNKYGKFGVHRVWHDTALPFREVLQQFEAWLLQHHLLEQHNGRLHRAAFVTCGNWDVKTKIPQQCKVSKMKLPPYFMEWINLKDVYQNFYKPRKEARGMRTMMEQLKIPMSGSHHLGIDDTKNIARVLLRMLADGAVIPVTAWKNPESPERTSFLYKNRI